MVQQHRKYPGRSVRNAPNQKEDKSMREKIYTGLYGYMGAKGMDAEGYVDMFKYHTEDGREIRRFVETNFGAGNVISAACCYDVRVSNDIDPDIAFLADMMTRKKDREAVIDKILDMEISPEVFQLCKALTQKKGFRDTDPVEAAAAIWYLFLHSFNGGRSGWSKGNELNPNPVLSKLDHLDTFEGVQIRNMDMLDLLREEKQHPDLLQTTMYYLDPPYLNNEANYTCNAETPEFHRTLAQLLEGIPYVMVCGFDNEIYEEILCRKLHFFKYDLREKHIAMSYVRQGEVRMKKTEFIWTTYPIGDFITC